MTDQQQESDMAKPQVVRQEAQQEDQETPAGSGLTQQGEASLRSTNSTLMSALAITTATKAQIEQTTEFMLHAIETAEAKLHEAKEFVLADCARLKGEMDGMVVAAQAIVQQAEATAALVQDIQSKRAKILNPGEGTPGAGQQK